MWDRVMIENILAGADVPSRVAVRQEALPSRRARAHEQPDQDGEKEQVGKGGDQYPRPARGED